MISGVLNFPRQPPQNWARRLDKAENTQKWGTPLAAQGFPPFSAYSKMKKAKYRKIHRNFVFGEDESPQTLAAQAMQAHFTFVGIKWNKWEKSGYCNVKRKWYNSTMQNCN